MFAERGAEHVTDLDHPRLVVLRRIDGAAIVGRRAHVDALRDEVDEFPPERAHLTHAHADLQPAQHHRAPRSSFTVLGASPSSMRAALYCSMQRRSI